jgi:hypothetical protein
MGLVGLGTATLMKNMVGIQKRTDLKSTIVEIKEQLEQYILDDTAWNYSVQGNTELACLRDTTPNCTHNPDNMDIDTGGPFLSGFSAGYFAIYDTQGNRFLRGHSGTPNGGFTPDGVSCNSFDPDIGEGSDDCPFRYNIAVWYKCVNGQPTCSRPQVFIRGELVYNPEDPAALNARINVDDYRIDLQRGRATRADTFQIVHRDPSPPFYPAGDSIGGGNCSPGSEVQRYFTDETFDTGDNVELLLPLPNRGFRRFRIQAGTYECKVSTQSFEPQQGYSVFLWTLGSGRRYPAGGGFAGRGSTAHSTESVNLVLDDETIFELRHHCGASYNAANRWDLGIPLQGYTTANPTVYTSITCTRSS